MRERRKVARRAKFSKRRTTTFVNDDDSKRLKELQEKYEDNQVRGIKPGCNTDSGKMSQTLTQSTPC